MRDDEECHHRGHLGGIEHWLSITGAELQPASRTQPHRRVNRAGALRAQHGLPGKFCTSGTVTNWYVLRDRTTCWLGLPASSTESQWDSCFGEISDRRCPRSGTSSARSSLLERRPGTNRSSEKSITKIDERCAMTSSEVKIEGCI